MKSGYLLALSLKNCARLSLSTMIPPITVPDPEVYFEVEWTTTSTPFEIGLNKAAVATVLSHIVRTPLFFAISTIFSISAIATWGFDKLSKNIAFVLLFCRSCDVYCLVWSILVVTF